MPARKTHEGVENVYAATQKWIDVALLNDDSLFTPDKPIWTRELLGELHECYLERPEVPGPNFYARLEKQLEGSPLEAYQLMAEVLYVHFLVIWRTGMRSDTKLRRINEVIGWSGQQIRISPDLTAGLHPGIANIGQARSSLFPFMVGYIIEFVEQWKELGPEEQRRLLNDSWSFKYFATGVDLRGALFLERPNAHRPQLEAILHLVFPDVFEGSVSINDKNSIARANAFSHFVTEEASDVDRKLAQIRKCLEAYWGRDFDFYDEGVLKYWKPAKGEQLVEELDGIASKHKSTSINESRNGYLPSLATQLFLPANFLREINDLLTDKRQVIFQGPPGTGKTYVAQQLANHLARDKARVTFVQFHPSYAYEDFVRGFRPKLENDQSGFELVDGPLIQAAKRAKDDDDNDRNHFLIIDEINRGSIAKVFGELYYLLEYRDEEISLQYRREEGETFSLPKNLYIIGTMNTADRSIALVDLALRRRFYFVEFHPDEEPIKSVLRQWLEENAPDMKWVADVVGRVNELLEDDRHAAIGPSYFMRDGLDDDAVERIWKHSVLPYIEERRFGGEVVTEEFSLARLRRQVEPSGGSPDTQGEPQNGDDGADDASA